MLMTNFCNTFPNKSPDSLSEASNICFKHPIKNKKRAKKDPTIEHGVFGKHLDLIKIT